MEFEPSKKWKLADLSVVRLEHYKIAESFDRRHFKVGEFEERYTQRYPDRHRTSMLPSDFAYNNDQEAKDDFPSFLERVDRATYRFIGLVDPISDGGRNPNWSRDELILALDFYRRHRAAMPGKESDEIAGLSQTLNRLQQIIGGERAETFRNPNGVYMKLMNLRRFDPDFTSEGKVGLSRGGKGDEEVWNEFWHDPDRLKIVASSIKGSIESGTWSEADLDDRDDDTIAEAEEGRILTRIHRNRERSTKLVKNKKRSFLKRHGRVYCEACGFDFGETYGQRGNGFIECHHTKPVSELKPGEKTKLSDLVLLCANCHRMIHAKAPWLHMSQLSSILTNQN